jgi:hypothetical protein
MVPPELRDKFSEMIEQKLKEGIDDVLDFAENRIEETETQWDDATIGQVIALIRTKFEIPDDIGGDED